MTESSCCVQVVCGRHTALIEEYGIFLKAQQLLAQVLPSRSSHTARRLSAALAESRQGRHTNDDSPDSGRDVVESELNTSGEEVPTGMQPVPVPAALLRGWLQRQERCVERREEARDSPGDGGRRSASPHGGKATHVEKPLTMQRGRKGGEEGEASPPSSSASETAAAAGRAPIRQSSLTVQSALEYASATYGAVHLTTWTHYEEAKAIHCAEHATAAAPCMLLTVVVLWLHEGVMYRLAPSDLAEVDQELNENPERGDDVVLRPSHRHVSAASSSPQSQQQQHFPSPSRTPSSSSSLFTCLLQLEYPPGTLLPQRLPVPLSEPLLTRLELVELVRRTANIRRHHALRVAYQVHPRHYAQPRLTSAAASVLRGGAAEATGGRRGNGQRAVRTSTLSGPPLHAIESEAAVAVFVRAILTHGSAAVRVVAVERRRAVAPATLPSVEVSVDGDDNHSEEREGRQPQRTHASATAAQKRSASSAAVPSTQMYDVQPTVSNAATTLQPRVSAAAPSPATLRSPYTIEPLAVHDAVFREATPTRSSSSSSCSSAARQSDSAAAVAAVDGHVRHRHASSPLEADLEVAREDCRDGDDCEEEEEEDTAQQQQQQQANDVELSEAKSDTADSPESFALKKPDKDTVESTNNNTIEKGADGDDDAPPFARGLGSARVLAMCSSSSTTTATTLTASRPSVLASAHTNTVITGGAATAAVDLQQRAENHGVPSKGAGRGFDTTASTSETCSHHSHTREPVSISPYDVALQALDPHHLYSASACGDGGGGSRNASHGRDDRASAPRQQHSSQTRSPPPPPPPVATANAAIDTSKTGEGPTTVRKDDGRVEKQAEAPQFQQQQHQQQQGKEHMLPAPPAIPRPPGPDDDFGMTWRNPELYGPTARPSAGQPTVAGFTLHDNDAPTSMSSRPSPQQRESGWGHKEGAVVGAQEAQLIDTHSDTAAPLAVAASTPPVQRATSSIGSSSAPDRHSLVFVRYEAEPTAVFVSGPVVPAVLQQLQDVIYRRCCAHLSRDVDSPRPRFHAAGGGGGGGGRGTEAARNSLGAENQESDSVAAGGVEYVLPLYAYTFTRTEEKALECCIAEVMAVYQGLEQLPAMEAEEWVHIAASTAEGPAAAPATAAA